MYSSFAIGEIHMGVRKKDLNRILKLYNDYFLGMYSGIVALVADKPRQVLVELENITTHLFPYFEDPDSEEGKKNFEMAFNHLKRASIDCAKMYWSIIDKQIEKIDKDDTLRRYAINMPEHEFKNKYLEFKKSARSARYMEMSCVGKNSEACLDEYVKSN